MKAHPNAISRICHHSSPFELLLLIIVGESMPVIEGKGGVVIVPLTTACGINTNSERHAPNEGIMSVSLVHWAVVHKPCLSTDPGSAHARHACGPGPTQLEQLASHCWHVPLVASKNWLLPHVFTHRPFCNTGLSAGQLAHCENDDPVHVAQSG